MNGPVMHPAQRITRDISVLSATLPIPGFGVLPVNSYVINSSQPVLVDTGLAALEQRFLAELGKIIDPVDLRWIWITHADADHLGNLAAVLAAAPQARVVTTYLGMGKMGMLGLPLERMYLLNPGQALDVGDRSLTAVAPPVFDAPETCGLFDPAAQALFSADCFGALLEQAGETAAEIHPDALETGCISWATVDAPWLHGIDPAKFREALGQLRRLNAKSILSAHLPPAHGMTDRLLDYLALAPQATRFVGPDQAMLERLMVA